MTCDTNLSPEAGGIDTPPEEQRIVLQFSPVLLLTAWITGKLFNESQEVAVVDGWSRTQFHRAFTYQCSPASNNCTLLCRVTIYILSIWNIACAESPYNVLE